MLYQASTATKGECLRSGTIPPPTAASPWQTLQKRPNSASPLVTLADAGSVGGVLSVSADSGGTAGRVPVAPSRKASTRLMFRTLPDLPESFPSRSGYAPPHPASTAMDG